jgi:molybdenum cofactor biosynthesis enzyme MoaA|tara:strand:- start:716 stop:1903 length:1188 start_codon:yes stop_codon:yes gene_type:complete
MTNINDSFCFFPFVHANIRANNDRNVAPCWRSDEMLGKLNDSTLQEIWNGDEYKTLRQQFLDGKKPAGCSRCWKLEENNETKNLSLRSWYLENYAHYYKDIMKDPLNPTLRSVELRFSNLCNLSCLHCGSQHSTTWNNKLKKHGEIKGFQSINPRNPRIITKDEVDSMIPMFATLDEIRITGGEPLTDPVFYHFLEVIPAEIAKNIELLVVSNLMTLKYEDKDAISLFEKFKEVKLRASVDADEATFSYFRSGGNIEIVKENIDRIQSYTNNVSISGVCAVNILNITRLDNIIKFHEQRNMYFKVMFVQERPHYLDIRNLPQVLKDKINSQSYSYTLHNEKEMQRVLDFMNSSPGDAKHFADLKTYLFHIDKMNGTNFLNTYSEFKEYWHDTQPN